MSELLRKLERGLVPRQRILGKRPAEHMTQLVEIASRQPRQRFGGLGADGRDAAPPQHLVHHRCETEDISAPIPRGRRHPLRRRVWPAHGEDDFDLLERAGDADAGQPRFVGRQHHVARVQSAMRDAGDGSEIEPAGQLGSDTQRLARRHRAMIADCDIERLGRHVLLSEVGARAHDPRLDRRGQGRMRQFRSYELLEFPHEAMHAVWRRVEAKQFDRNESVAFWIVRTKDWSQYPRANLMKNTKRAEGVFWRGAGNIRVQWKNSWKEAARS